MIIQRIAWYYYNYIWYIIIEDFMRFMNTKAMLSWNGLIWIYSISRTQRLNDTRIIGEFMNIFMTIFMIIFMIILRIF